MSVRLYFGNLPRDLESESFESLFSEDASEIVSVKLISDRKTGKCRGFGFVTTKSEEAADALVSKYNGSTFQEATLKVEKAMPRTEKEKTKPSGNGSARRSSKKSGRKGGNTVVVSETQSASAEPDPRWAQDLAKLKEMLAAQTTPS